MSKKKTSTYNPATGKFYFGVIPHHEEMRKRASVTNDESHAVQQNLADITAMTHAVEAIRRINHDKPIL